LFQGPWSRVLGLSPPNAKLYGRTNREGDECVCAGAVTASRTSLACTPSITAATRSAVNHFIETTQSITQLVIRNLHLIFTYNKSKKFLNHFKLQSDEMYFEINGQ